jgi:hypothetical protein
VAIDAQLEGFGDLHPGPCLLQVEGHVVTDEAPSKASLEYQLESWPRPGRLKDSE